MMIENKVLFKFYKKTGFYNLILKYRFNINKIIYFEKIFNY